MSRCSALAIFNVNSFDRIIINMPTLVRADMPEEEEPTCT